MSRRKLILLIAGLLFFLLFYVASQSQRVQNLRYLLQPETEDEVVLAFAVSLRLNDPIAYKVADLSLSNRIDDWMETNQVRKCDRRIDLWGGRGVDGIHDIYFSCYLEDGSRFNFLVIDIVVEEQEDSFRVVDWGSAIGLIE